MRILRGRSLQVRLPERESQRPDQRLQLLRRSMRLHSHLQLQDQLGVRYRPPRISALSGRVPEPQQCAAFLLTREEESILNHDSLSRSLERI